MDEPVLLSRQAAAEIAEMMEKVRRLVDVVEKRPDTPLLPRRFLLHWTTAAPGGGTVTVRAGTYDATLSGPTKTVRVLA